MHHKTPKMVTWAPENKGEQVKQGADLEVLEERRLEKLKKAGIRVLPAAARYNRSGWTSMRAAVCVYSLTDCVGRFLEWKILYDEVWV